MRQFPSFAGGGASELFGGRARWLGSPGFLACVAVLVLNDHLLKGAFPGWWTGKLSDVAGVLVAATVAGALIGPRRGISIVAALFVMLKVVPGVAELVSPALGGVTRRDETDLIALVALLPLWYLLTRFESRDAASSATRSDSQWREFWAQCRTALSAGLPLVGVIVAAASATATSCGPAPAVTEIAVDGGDMYALVTQGLTSAKWARSTDGGFSWQDTEPPAAAQGPERSPDSYRDPGPAGPLKACDSDGTCWRLRDQRVIERGSESAGWVEEARLTDAEFSEITTGCAGGSVGVLESIGAANGAAGREVVASLGADGALVRHGGGGWEQVEVLSAPPRQATAVEDAASTAVLFSGPVLALLLWLLGRRRWPSWRVGLVVAGVGWLATCMASAALSFALSFLAGPDSNPSTTIGRVGIAGMAITTVVSIVVARRPRPARGVPPSPPPFQPSIR